MKIVVAISGASGVNLGLKTLYALPEHVEKHLIISEHADIVLENRIKTADLMMEDGRRRL